MIRTMKTISDLVYCMVTRDGFVSAFWRELAAARRLDPSVTQRQVFDRLNEMFEAEFGRPRFVSFDAFRVYRDSKK